jgi:hypothetical protein
MRRLSLRVGTFFTAILVSLPLGIVGQASAASAFAAAASDRGNGHGYGHRVIKQHVDARRLPPATGKQRHQAAPPHGRPAPASAASGSTAPIVSRAPSTPPADGQPQGAGPVQGATTSGLSSAGSADPVGGSDLAAAGDPNVGALEQLANFAGAGVACCIPPDTQVAVGPTNVVEMVNATGRITTKGGTQTSSFNLSGLFGAPDNAMNAPFYSDPRVVYDAFSGRFFASMLIFDSCNPAPPPAGSGCTTSSNSEVDLAVSTDNTGTSWTVYDIQNNQTNTLYDQPKLGVSGDKVVMTWNNTGFAGPYQFVVVQKSDLLAGGTIAVYFFPLDTTHFNVIPVVSLGATNTEFAVNVNQNASTLTVTAFTGTPNGNNVAKTHTDLAIGSISTPPGAAQPSSGPNLDSGVSEMKSAVWQNNQIWAVGGTGCTPTDDTTTRACIRIDTVSTSGTPALLQDVDLGQTGAYLTYPAVMVDTFGNFFVGHSVSSSSQFPTAGMTFAPVGPLPGTVTGIDYATGAGVYSNIDSNGLNRWGDYSGAARDPSNPKDVWFAEEYGSTSNTNQGLWGTQIGRFTQAPPTVTGVSPNSGPELNTACAPTVTVTGTDFVTNQTTVTFGGTAASSVNVTSPESLTAIAPSHTRGTVDITLTTPAGTSPTGPSDQFTYLADTTAPTSTASPSPAPVAGNDGWTTGPVTVSLSADDGTCGSGVKNVSYSAAGAQTIPLTTVSGSSTSFAISQEGVTTITFSATDNADNAEAAKTLTVKIDNTAPRVAFATPPAGEPYLLSQPVAASYSCIDRVDGTDGGVGVASCNGTVTNGTNINTTAIGTYTFTVNTADKLGNATSQSTGYRVTYKICLQYDPTKPSGARGYVITVQICNYNNVNQSVASIHLTATAVDSNPAKLKALGNLNPGNVFLYGPGTSPGASYTYNLDTKGLTNGSHVLNFTVQGDPVAHTAPFIIKK